MSEVFLAAGIFCLIAVILALSLQGKKLHQGSFVLLVRASGHRQGRKDWVMLSVLVPTALFAGGPRGAPE
jgi:hypothetical protein